MEVILTLLGRLATAEIIVDQDNVICAINSPPNLLSELRSECDDVMINPSGQLCQEKVVALATRGFKHQIFECDTFGPLRCGIDTGHGWLMYG